MLTQAPSACSINMGLKKSKTNLFGFKNSKISGTKFQELLLTSNDSKFVRFICSGTISPCSWLSFSFNITKFVQLLSNCVGNSPEKLLLDKSRIRSWLMWAIEFGRCFFPDVVFEVMFLCISCYLLLWIGWEYSISHPPSPKDPIDVV